TRTTRGSRPVHPRWRGEHDPLERIAGHDTGSSPLARGTKLGRSIILCLWRFIPAGAGNTHEMQVETAPLYGSSPLARGTHHRLVPALPVDRFIPAGAGNTGAACR